MFVAKILPLALVLPHIGCMTDGPLIPGPFGPTKAELEVKKAQLDAKDDEVCKGYGAKPGTDVYVQCRMSQSQQRVMADSAPGPVVINNNSSEPAKTPAYSAAGSLPMDGRRTRSGSDGLPVIIGDV